MPDIHRQDDPMMPMMVVVDLRQAVAPVLQLWLRAYATAATTLAARQAAHCVRACVQ
jgi:hypothetical protein